MFYYAFRQIKVLRAETQAEGAVTTEKWSDEAQQKEANSMFNAQGIEERYGPVSTAFKVKEKAEKSA